MRTYDADNDAGDQGHPDSREWVFGLLETPRFRERVEQLEALDLRRRAGCEPCLRALVVDDWTPDTLYHVGWCDSCRTAAIALGMHAPRAAGAAWYRRRVTWLAVAAVAAIAVPLVGSQMIGRDHGSPAAGRGGVATKISSSGTPGTTGTPVTTGTTGTPVTPVPRSKPATAVGHERGAKASASGKKALPLTT